MLTPKVAKARSELANAHKLHPDAVEPLRQQFKYVSAEAYIERLLSECPPLSPEQRDRLALLFRDDRPAVAA